MAGDLSKKDRAEAVMLVGSDASGGETYPAQVDLVDGVRRLQTTGLVQIEELFGQDNQGDAWLYIGTQYDVGPIAAGDTISVHIGAGPNAGLFPAIDLTYVVTAGDVAAVNPEIAVANGLANLLNNNAAFKTLWLAKRIADNSVVWIGSKLIGEWSERPNVGDFAVTKTGSIGVQAAFDMIVRRGKSTTLTKDPNDPRKGVLGITGTVAQSVEEIGQLLVHNLELGADGSGVYAMNVDGSVTPQVFQEHAVLGYDTFIKEIRLYAVSSGAKFGQFLNISTALANGLLVEIKSDDSLLALPPLKTTEDMKNKFALSGTWLLESQPSLTSMLATFKLDAPFPIRHIGEFAVDDYLKITVRDNLTSVADLGCIVFGFKREI